MKIKLIDFLSIIDRCNSIQELKIKSDLLYGEKFDIILDKFLQKMGYKIDPDTLTNITVRDLSSFLGMIGNNFEIKNRILINKSIDYNNDYYNKYIDEYYLPDCFKYENISIDI